MFEADRSPLNKMISGETMNNKIINFSTKEENLHYAGVWDVEPQEVSEKADQVFLVDVRQPDEFVGDLGHIPGAKLIVLDTLMNHLGEIPKDQTVVFVCRSGGRSARAAAFALENGFQHVFNLKGGMILWNELHLDTQA
jgi:rhodanese-related sulfurtransferase